MGLPMLGAVRKKDKRLVKFILSCFVALWRRRAVVCFAFPGCALRAVNVDTMISNISNPCAAFVMCSGDSVCPIHALYYDFLIYFDATGFCFAPDKSHMAFPVMFT